MGVKTQVFLVENTMSPFLAGVNTNCGQVVYNMDDLVIYFFGDRQPERLLQPGPMLKEGGAAQALDGYGAGSRQR